MDFVKEWQQKMEERYCIGEEKKVVEEFQNELHSFYIFYVVYKIIL